MEDKELETLFNELNSWSKALVISVEDTLPSIQHALQSNEPLPVNCPSKASLAEMELRQIQKKLSELNGIYKLIHEHLFKEYGQTNEKIH